MTQGNSKDKMNVFNPEDHLLLHQLRLLEWIDAKNSNEEGEREEAQIAAPVLPAKWYLTKDVTLYPWQKECVNSWFENKTRGTVKVVTGGGKTMLALSIIEKLQNTKLSDLRVVIIVPTIVLMNQWYEEISKSSNIPAKFIAKRGGGYKEDFSEGRRILICVLASACKELPRLVKEATIGSKLLLIADECHRFGAKKMAHVFAAERAFSLGLSATPERDEDDDENEASHASNDSREKPSYDNRLLGQELGGIICNYTLSDALKDGIIPRFTINHYGLNLNRDERVQYDRLSRSISDKRKELQARAPKGCSSGGSFFGWVRKTAKQNRGQLSWIASNFESETTRRKALLYGMESRKAAVEKLIDKELAVNPDARIVLFHEKIEEVNNLFVRLKNKNLPVIAEHSQLPDSIREAGLELFRKGIAQIIVSARSLIEGFNVPAIDVGIIVASSTSSRQRIQSLGRVLRKHRSSTGEEKTSCTHILYAHNTKDDAIYSKEEWGEITGVECNNFFLWDTGKAPQKQDGPPKKPLPADINVDSSKLEPGCVYPGKYEGEEFKYDTNGNISNSSGQYVKSPGSIIENIQNISSRARRFKVTQQCNYVLVSFCDDTVWKTKFVCKLIKQFEYHGADPEVSYSDETFREWVSKALPGDLCKFQSVPIVFKVKYKTKQGRNIISKKVKGGEVFARTEEKANDKLMGRDADTLVGIIKNLKKQIASVTQFEVNEMNHVLYRQGGSYYFVYALKIGLEFPD
jgi:superfamily II DNA or RNA helicase